MNVRLGKSSVKHEIADATDEQLAGLITQVTNEINWYMSQRKLTRADLASRMGVSPGRISQVLSGGENLTLRTLASLAVALDGQFELELKPCKATEDAYATSHAHDDDATAAGV
jgi:transcriptional regulator with XRE-family HTH domain